MAVIPCVTPPYIFYWYGVTHGITVVCHHPLSCYIYTVLVSLIFGTAIPTSFNISMKCFYYTLVKCKNIFTKMLNDVGIEVPKSMETRSKFSMHADKGRG